jgi:hypothetical protein
MEKNRIITKNSALVEGIVTPLAGCDGHSKGCTMSCLRADPALQVLQRMNSVKDCRYFIPA